MTPNDLSSKLLSMANPERGTIEYGVATGTNQVGGVTLPAIAPVATGQYCAVWVNEGDRLILGPVSGATVGGRWRRVANQASVSGTPLAISWDTEDYDPYGMLAIPGTTLTIPSTGVWALQAALLDMTGVVNARHMAYFQVTSTLTGVSGQYRGNGYGDDNVGLSAVLQLAAADTVRVDVQQSSGAGHNYQARLAISRVA